jgi:hypothetical protein
MSIPRNSDAEARQLLEEAGWPWSDWEMAFVKARDPERETREAYRSQPNAYVTIEELRGHHLAGSASSAQRPRGRLWCGERRR